MHYNLCRAPRATRPVPRAPDPVPRAPCRAPRAARPVPRAPCRAPRAARPVPHAPCHAPRAPPHPAPARVPGRRVFFVSLQFFCQIAGGAYQSLRISTQSINPHSVCWYQSYVFLRHFELKTENGRLKRNVHTTITCTRHTTSSNSRQPKLNDKASLLDPLHSSKPHLYLLTHGHTSQEEKGWRS